MRYSAVQRYIGNEFWLAIIYNFRWKTSACYLRFQRELDEYNYAVGRVSTTYVFNMILFTIDFISVSLCGHLYIFKHHLTKMIKCLSELNWVLLSY